MTQPPTRARPVGRAFRDGKDPAALRTIGEVAKALGLRQHVLRYWEEQFPMLRPLTRAGGRRYYRPEDIALIEDIDRLVHREGYTIRGARQALSRPVTAHQPVAPHPVRTPEPEPQPIVPALAALGDDNRHADEPGFGDALLILRAHIAGIRERLAGACEN